MSVLCVCVEPVIWAHLRNQRPWRFHSPCAHTHQQLPRQRLLRRATGRQQFKEWRCRNRNDRFYCRACRHSLLHRSGYLPRQPSALRPRRILRPWDQSLQLWVAGRPLPVAPHRISIHALEPFMICLPRTPRITPLKAETFGPFASKSLTLPVE